MGKDKKTSGGASTLVKALYIIAGVLAVVFVYMVVINILYINNYVASYGMKFSDMWMDSLQYIISGSISYFVYATLVFCVGKIIVRLDAAKSEETESQDVEDDSVSGKEKNDDLKADQEESAEEVLGHEENDVPESEDAVEKTEIIEDGSGNQAEGAEEESEESEETKE